ncbi:MAG: tetratricopeptide repeat protein [Bacteroidales bacterium]|nr:tetratricopeptide repeat protein [Bacteroidales bacterium]
MKPAKKNPRKEPARNPTLLFNIFTVFTIIFIPVFHIPRALDQALMPRTMALSVFVLLMAFWFFGRKKVSHFSFSIFRRNIFPVLLGYLAVVIISIAFAVNYRESFYDIVRTFLFVSVVGISALVFSHSDGWQKKLPKFVIVAAGIALIIGAVQYYKHVITGTVTLLPDGRPVIYLVSGLMFHKNEYSTALMLMLPFVAYAIYIYRGAWRAAAIVTALLLLVMIVLVQTRAVWVGLAVSFAAVTVIYVFYARSLSLPLLYRNILIGGMLAGLIGIAIIFSIEKPEDPRSLLGRVRSITDTGSKDNVHRLNIWKSTIELIKDRPLTGTGAGNWRLNAAYYFDGKFDQVPQLNWARPHNDFLWVFAEKGLIGFLLYLAYFGFAFYYLLRIIRRSPKTEDKILALLFFAGIVAYLAVSFFSFPYERINHQVYMGIFIGGSLAMLQAFSPALPFNPSRRAILTPVIIFSVFGAMYGYNTTVQENYLNKALSAMKAENWRAYLHNAQMATNPFKSLDPLSNPPEYYEGMALAKLNRHPEAVVAYEKAFRQFPNNMWILHWMGQSYYQVGRYEEAIECLEKVLEIIPEHKEAYINLSATYYKMGDYQKSADALKRIKDWEKDEAVVRNLGVLENLLNPETGKP